MAKPKAATPATVAQWHETFRNSLFYWTGLLEDRYNQLFVQAMRPQRVTVSRYSERSALSRLLDQLEREGLISRRLRATDRRALEIRIAPKGRDAYLAMRPVRRAVLKRATEGIAPGEIERMRTVIQLMLHNLDGPAAPRRRSKR